MNNLYLFFLMWSRIGLALSLHTYTKIEIHREPRLGVCVAPTRINLIATVNLYGM